MKTLLFLIIVLGLFSCVNKSTESRRIVVIVDQKTPPILKDTVIISRSDYDEIQKFSLAAKDVAMYLLLHKREWTVSTYTIGCGNYHIWIGNGYDHLSIYKPVEYDLNKSEKDFFWKLFKTYQRQKMRLYKYEDEFIIKTKN